MTNEEAKEFLQGRIRLIDSYYPQVKDYREALVIAIKAIEALESPSKRMSFIARGMAEEFKAITMPADTLKVEDDETGYHVTKKRPSIRCGECKYLTGERSSIGIVCENPDKYWRTKTAMYKYRHTPACKLFEEGGGEDEP